MTTASELPTTSLELFPDACLQPCYGGSIGLVTPEAALTGQLALGLLTRDTSVNLLERFDIATSRVALEGADARHTLHALARFSLLNSDNWAWLDGVDVKRAYNDLPPISRLEARIGSDNAYRMLYGYLQHESFAPHHPGYDWLPAVHALGNNRRRISLRTCAKKLK
ncbi:MAG TPA: hypothetical protein VFH39_01510 [Candidatus Saccharimonadales bacterium]|nr:hypothetical protein [Candidatus Saccharimonadales bacterium]